MRIIAIPEPIKVKFDDGEKTFTCKEVLLHQLDLYGELKTLSMLREAQKVAEAIEAGNGTISLEDSQYELLKAACQQPKYIPKVGMKVLPFFDAVEKAEEVKK